MADSESDPDLNWEPLREKVEAANSRKIKEFFDSTSTTIKKRKTNIEVPKNFDTNSEFDVKDYVDNMLIKIGESDTLDEVEKQKQKMDEDFHIHIKDVLGYDVLHIKGDGNCLFRAIGFQLNPSKDHSDVRLQVVDYMENNKDRFENFMEDNMNFEEYIDRMKLIGTWGGEVEVVAASEVFGVRISIFCPLSHNFYNGDPKHEKCKVILSYHGNNHYNVLLDARIKARVFMAKAKFEKLPLALLKDCHVTYEDDDVVLTRIEK